MGIRLRLRADGGAGGSAPSGGTPAPNWGFDQPRVVVGRAASADVVVPDPRVSGVHAILQENGPRWVVVDEGSKNGTAVDGRRLVPGRPRALRTGSVLRVGPVDLVVEVGTPVATPTDVGGTAALARRLARELLDPDGVGKRPPTLRAIDGPAAGQTWTLPPPPARLRLGRADDLELSLPDPDASRLHAELLVDDDGVTIVDAGSKNGVVVAGRPVRRTRLKDGAQVVIGRTHLLFEDLAERLVTGEARRPEAEVFDEPVEGAVPDPSGDDDAKNDAGEAGDEAADDGGDHDDPEDDPRSSRGSGRLRGRPAEAPGGSLGLGADLLVYALAALILALSAYGLATLLSE